MSCPIHIEALRPVAREAVQVEMEEQEQTSQMVLEGHNHPIEFHRLPV